MAMNEFIKGEIDKIIENESYEFPLNHAYSAVWILANFKGDNLKVFDMRKSSSLCDFSILGTAQNSTQARAMADEIIVNLKAHNASILSYEGYEGADWILIDTGDIIVHIFNGSARDIYDLDLIWAKRPQVQIPEDFYFGTPSMPKETNSDLKGYF